MLNIDDLPVHEKLLKKMRDKITFCLLFKKGKKRGVKYRRNLKHLEKTNVLN